MRATHNKVIALEFGQTPGNWIPTSEPDSESTAKLQRVTPPVTRDNPSLQWARHLDATIIAGRIACEVRRPRGIA